ncbi:MAG: hypothetical protein JWM10_756 [Myxococcaceae bacterium]|nr:hypothetical protein [Myxococcaceae bacterium]
MHRLTPDELRSRLALDYRAMRSLRGPTIGRIEAFASPLDVDVRRGVTDAEGLAGLATVYRVEFRFPMWRAAHRTLYRARVVLCIPTNAYPFAEPTVTFERPVPFAPHIQKWSGHVCTGSAWYAAQGNWLIANLVIHVMRLTNCDGPCAREGLNRQALLLMTAPLNPDLEYPVVDDRVTHSGVVTPGAAVPFVARRPGGFAPRAPSTGSEKVLFARRAW